MTTQDLSLFQAMTAKMSWLEQRQRVVSQNVANADTPGYTPQDLVPVDFSTLLRSSASAHSLNSGGAAVTKTNTAHIGGAEGKATPSKPKTQSQVYETAPAGNKVILEEQLLKADEVRMDHQLMINLYEKNRGLLRAAIGKGGN